MKKHYLFLTPALLFIVWAHLQVLLDYIKSLKTDDLVLFNPFAMSIVILFWVFISWIGVILFLEEEK